MLPSLKKLELLGASKEREYILENLSVLLNSGLSIVPALESINREVRSKPLKEVLSTMVDEIGSGAAVSESFRRSGLVSDYVITILEIGEESGTLSQNLKIIARQQQKDRALQAKIRSAVMYPILVLFITTVVALGIAWFILPRLAQVFGRLDLDLPLITRILITVGEILQDYGVIIIPVGLIMVSVLIYIFFFLPYTKVVGQTILLHTPGVSQLIRQIELSRFGYLFGNLLTSGVSILEALTMLKSSSGFIAYQALYEKLGSETYEGNSLEKTFAAHSQFRKLIPAPTQQIIITGEQSGHLADSLLEVGGIYEEQAEVSAKNLTVMLEPVLLVIVWLGVVAVAVAVILPLYSLISGLNNN